jgi:aldehyde dehydrogenase (NAD+)
MGGKNPAIILADANVDLAAEACAKAAFACAGQWCTSTSRVIVENSVHDGLLQRIVQLARAIRVGNGRHPTTQMGPVCGEKQRDSILSYIDIGKKEGAALVCGGGRPAEHGLDRGCFIEPTVFAEVDPGMTIAQEEIFGPVIVMIRVHSLQEAISVANGVPYGLSASIFTKDIGSALQFAEQIQAGVTHVNIMTAYKEPALCFGGFKCSGVGLPEAGQTGIQFFTDEKVVYVRGE